MHGCINILININCRCPHLRYIEWFDTVFNINCVRKIKDIYVNYMRFMILLQYTNWMHVWFQFFLTIYYSKNNINKIYSLQSLFFMTVVMVEDMYNQWHEFLQVYQYFLDVLLLDNVQAAIDEYIDCLFHNSNHNNIDML